MAKVMRYHVSRNIDTTASIIPTRNSIHVFLQTYRIHEYSCERITIKFKCPWSLLNMWRLTILWFLPRFHANLSFKTMRRKWMPYMMVNVPLIEWKRCERWVWMRRGSSPSFVISTLQNQRLSYQNIQPRAGPLGAHPCVESWHRVPHIHAPHPHMPA